MPKSEDDVLLGIAGEEDCGEALKSWRELLKQLGMASQWAVYAEPRSLTGWGIYLGKLDGQRPSDGRTKSPPR